MTTVLEALDKGEAYLEKAGVEQPRLDMQLLLADALGCKRLDLFLQHDRPLGEDILAPLRVLLKRRAAREPLQYLLGWVDFHGLRLRCDARALIPRPETEAWVDQLIESLREGQRPGPQTIADLGTGTGALALTLAQAFAEAHVVATDISAAALDLASENASAHALEVHLTFRQGSWFEALDAPVDLIVSNPPYLTQEEWESAQPEVRAHEPPSALVAGDAGAEDLRQLLTAAPAWLTPGGSIFLETGIDHAAELSALAEASGYRSWGTWPDLHGRDRVFWAQRKD